MGTLAGRLGGLKPSTSNALRLLKRKPLHALSLSKRAFPIYGAASAVSTPVLRQAQDGSLAQDAPPAKDGYFALVVGGKLDSLGQREFTRPVDRVRLAAHVAFPGVRARFATTAGFLLATEGAADFGA